MTANDKQLLEVALNTAVVNLTAAQKQLIRNNSSELDATQRNTYASVLAN